MLELVNEICEYSKGITKIDTEFYHPTKGNKNVKAPPPEVSFAFGVNKSIAVEVDKLEGAGGPSGIFVVESINDVHRDTLNAFSDNLKDCHDELKKFDTRRFNFIFFNRAKLLESIRNHAEKMQQFFEIYRVSIETNKSPEIDFSVYIEDEGALKFWLDAFPDKASVKYVNFVAELRKNNYDTSGIELEKYKGIEANVRKTKITPYTFNRIVRVCGGWAEFLARIKVDPASPSENFIQKISNTNTRVSPTLILSDDMKEAEPVRSEYPGQAMLGSIFLINRNGLLLSTENDDQDDGAKVVPYVPLGSTAQQWILGEDGKILHSSSKLFLTATELREGCTIAVMHDTKRDTQRWTFVHPGIIVSKANSNLALAIDEVNFTVSLASIESGRATPFKVVNFAPAITEYNASLDLVKQPKFGFYTPEARAFLLKALSEKKGVPVSNAAPQPVPPQFGSGGNTMFSPPSFAPSNMPTQPPSGNGQSSELNPSLPPPSSPQGFGNPPPFQSKSSFTPPSFQAKSAFTPPPPPPQGFGNPPPFQTNQNFNNPPFQSPGNPPPFQTKSNFNPPPPQGFGNPPPFQTNQNFNNPPFQNPGNPPPFQTKSNFNPPPFPPK